MISDVCNMGKTDWKDVVSQLKCLLDEADARKLMRRAGGHHNLRLYRPAWSIQADHLRPNRTLRNTKFDPLDCWSESRACKVVTRWKRLFPNIRLAAFTAYDQVAVVLRRSGTSYSNAPHTKHQEGQS